MQLMIWKQIIEDPMAYSDVEDGIIEPLLGAYN